MSIRIVIAEDHALMRETICRGLEQKSDLVVVGEAEDGEQGLQLIGSLQPDVAILDIRMPKLNGVEVVRQMKSISPETKALMLTAYDDDDYIIALMQAGASGYLLKTIRTKELVDSIYRVYSGEIVLHPSIAVKIARFWAQKAAYSKPGTSDHLSPRELEILELAAKGLRNKAIAENLGISIRTVEGHFEKIFSKLGVISRMEAVLDAISLHLITLNNMEIK